MVVENVSQNAVLSNQSFNFETLFKLIRANPGLSHFIPIEEDKKLSILSYYNVDIVHPEMNAEQKTLANSNNKWPATVLLESVDWKSVGRNMILSYTRAGYYRGKDFNDFLFGFDFAIFFLFQFWPDNSGYKINWPTIFFEVTFMMCKSCERKGKTQSKKIKRTLNGRWWRNKQKTTRGRSLKNVLGKKEKWNPYSAKHFQKNVSFIY